MTDQQIADLRKRQRATIEAALRTEQDPVKRRVWEGQLRKLRAWMRAEGLQRRGEVRHVPYQDQLV